MKDERKNLHRGHRARFLEQIHTNGLENMTEIQVLEFVLTFFIPRKDTNETAHLLINTFGNLKNVLDASAEELVKVDGIGERTAKLISLLPKVFFYYKESGLKDNKPKLNSLADMAKFLTELYESRPTEEFYVLFLNANNQLVKLEKIATGDVNEIHFDCQKIVNLALKFKPSYMILSHNHPDGVCEPSESDIKTTIKIAKLLHLHSFVVADHIIIGTNGYYSFNKNNMISFIYENNMQSSDDKFANTVYSKFVRNKFTYWLLTNWRF